MFSFLVLLCGAVSDFFDGYFARKLKVESKVGALLDPLSDKLFSNAVLWGICLFKEAPYPTLLVAISLTIRDFALLVGSLIVLLKKLTTNIKPIYASKICTALVFALCILSVIFNPNLLPLKILGILCFVFIVFTFFEYVRRVFKNAYSL
jgi:phosphatidylglycerophosphate synthase